MTRKILNFLYGPIGRLSPLIIPESDTVVRHNATVQVAAGGCELDCWFKISFYPQVVLPSTAEVVAVGEGVGAAVDKVSGGQKIALLGAAKGNEERGFFVPAKTGATVDDCPSLCYMAWLLCQCGRFLLVMWLPNLQLS